MTAKCRQSYKVSRTWHADGLPREVLEALLVTPTRRQLRQPQVLDHSDAWPPPFPDHWDHEQGKDVTDSNWKEPTVFAPAAKDIYVGCDMDVDAVAGGLAQVERKHVTGLEREDPTCLHRSTPNTTGCPHTTKLNSVEGDTEDQPDSSPLKTFLSDQSFTMSLFPLTGHFALGEVAKRTSHLGLFRRAPSDPCSGARVSSNNVLVPQQQK